MPYDHDEHAGVEAHSDAHAEASPEMDTGI
jgi:hypothetical protein